MPNRTLKESIRTSKNVNSLSDFQFRLWINLITYVDDYGRGRADADIVKSFVLPRRKGVTETQVANALNELANAGMIGLYDVDGESFLYFPNWKKHYNPRAEKSKFPDPPENGSASICKHLQTSASNCLQVQADAPDTDTDTDTDTVTDTVTVKTPYNPPSGDVFVRFADGNAELLASLRDFSAMRKKNKSPLTDRAKQMLLSKLKKLSDDPVVQAKILDQSTYHGWKDVYELKEVEHESNRGVPSLGEIGIVL